jgi:hypothetical protein
MKRAMPYKIALSLMCTAIALLAKGATPSPVEETLDEVIVQGTKERERERTQLTDAELKGYFFYLVRRDNGTRFQLSLVNIRDAEVRFRRASSARRLGPKQTPASPVRLEGNRLLDFDALHTNAVLSLDDNIEEADHIPASIPFGPQTALVNLDHLRLQDTRFQTHITVVNGIDPQTRRCEEKFALLDDGREGPNRFILLADTYAHCRRAERAREGDLVFADTVPEKLRQVVTDTYGPVAVRFANRLGSEPGQIFVAWLQDSPDGNIQFERSWNRNSLLLFKGATWQAGLSSPEREALWSTFATEQVQRRFRQTERSGTLTETAAGYLLALAHAERAPATYGSLAEALPVWIAGCARRMDEDRDSTIVPENVPGNECGMLVQFVYDAVARFRSRGRETIYDTWRRLLNASFRRGESGASPADFLATSDEAHRIVQGLLDGTVDWNQFAAALDNIGVRLEFQRATGTPSASVLELTNFRD